jgi:NTE family protein
MTGDIALCLSGGGFRSALFHLGALRRLRELGLLQQVSLVSSVSGGSIVSGFFADVLARSGPFDSRDGFGEWLDTVDWETAIAAPFRRVTARDFRTGPVLNNVLWNWFLPGPRVAHLERIYRRRVSELKLGALPRYPRFVFCATDLTFGVNWAFDRERAGDYQAGYFDASDWPLARAIAASSCFPPIFGPLPIRADPAVYKKGHYRGGDRRELLERIMLTDGGVYDNLGLEPAWKELSSVLVSDCGAPFAFSAGKLPLRNLLRYTSVIMNQASSLRKRMLFERRRAGDYTATYWGIRGSSVPDAAAAGYSSELVEERIAEVRTDLDAFTVAEQKVLENHGYLAANHSVTQHLEGRELRAVACKPPHPEWMDETLVRDALATSHRRISLTRWLRILKERSLLSQ